MSSFTDNRTYFESIQKYFLERTGKGLMLSSRDLELLIGWRQSGASAHVVCRGIDEAVASLQSAPRDLHAVKRYVEPRLSEPTSAAPVFESPRADEGASDGPAESRDPWVIALTTLSQARDHSGRPELIASFMEVTRRIQEARAAHTEPWTALYELDDFLVTDAFARLGEDERRMIDLEIEGRHGARLAVMDEQTRQQTMLESRRRAMRDRWQLPSLTE